LIVGSTKADIGRDAVINSYVLQHLALWGNNGDATVDEGGYSDIAVAVDCERIQQLVSGQSAQHSGRIRWCQFSG